MIQKKISEYVLVLANDLLLLLLSLCNVLAQCKAKYPRFGKLEFDVMEFPASLLSVLIFLEMMLGYVPFAQPWHSIGEPEYS